MANRDIYDDLKDILNGLIKTVKSDVKEVQQIRDNYNKRILY